MSISLVDGVPLLALCAGAIAATIAAPSSQYQECVINVKVCMSRDRDRKISGCKKDDYL